MDKIKKTIIIKILTIFYVLISIMLVDINIMHAYLKENSTNYSINNTRLATKGKLLQSPTYFVLHITDGNYTLDTLDTQFSAAINGGPGGYTPYIMGRNGDIRILYDQTKYHSEGTQDLDSNPGKRARVRKVTNGLAEATILYENTNPLDKVAYQVKMIAKNGSDATIDQAKSAATLISVHNIIPKNVLTHYSVQPGDRQYDNPFISKDGSVDGRLIALVTEVRKLKSGWGGTKTDKELAAYITRINLSMAKQNGDASITNEILDKLNKPDADLVETNPGVTTPTTPTTPGGGTGSSTGPGKITYKSFTAFPGIGQISGLCELTKALWFIGFGILFISVLGMYMYGGFLYTSAGVNASGVNRAKDIFTNSTIGLVLGLSIYVILNTINPNLLNSQCTIDSVMDAPTGTLASNPSGPYTSSNPGECKPTGRGTECNGGGLTGTCTQTDPSKFKFQGGISMNNVDPRLGAIATSIFTECAQYGEFQISSAKRNNNGGSQHDLSPAKALDWADGSQNIVDKDTGKCIMRVARSCGVSRINPETDASQKYHIHIDLKDQ